MAGSGSGFMGDDADGSVLTQIIWSKYTTRSYLPLAATNILFAKEQEQRKWWNKQTNMTVKHFLVFLWLSPLFVSPCHGFASAVPPKPSSSRHGTRNAKNHHHSRSRRISSTFGRLQASSLFVEQAHHFPDIMAPTLYPLTLSLLAGLSTTLGALLALVPTRTPQEGEEAGASSATIMSGSLALAGSVMVTVTLYSIIPECIHEASSRQDIVQGILCLILGGTGYAVLAHVVFPPDSAGDEEIALAWLSLDHQPTRRSLHNNQTVMVPMPNHDAALMTMPTHDATTSWEDRRRAWRLTLVLFATLAAHNFPEGLAVAASAVHSQRLGQTTAIAIALHNIPEGLAIGVPCLAARPDAPWLAVGLATLSGLAEPLGALVTVCLLQQQSQHATIGTVVTQQGLPNVLALVGGIMSAVACRELFPEACWYSKKRGDYTPFAVGVVLGAGLMVGSEAVLAK